MPSATVGRAILAGLALGVPGLAASEPPRVERVEIAGSHQMPAGSYLFYVGTKAGDAYDDLRLHADFRRLWDTGFLDDLRLDVEDGAQGKVVRFVLAERPRVRVIDYSGSKELSATAISDRLKEEQAALQVDHFLDPGRTRRAEAVVKRMLGEKGYLFATVRHETRPLGGAGVQLSFVIQDGLRARVRQVGFDGNETFSDSALKRRLKTKERRFWNFAWLTGNDVFKQEQWEEDQRRLTDFYLDRSHVQAQVGTPRMSYEDGSIGLFRRKPIKWVDLTVPVAEGPPFQVGRVEFRGLTVFDADAVRPLFALQEGQPYRESALRKGHEHLRDAYGARGYPFMTGRTERTPDAERRVVDVVVAVDEDRLYRVGRIRFTGNDTTRDAVLRREVFLNEQDVLSTERLKQTVRRLNQLGYFKPVGAPKIEPHPQQDDLLDVTFGLEEQNRNQFTLSASTGADLGPTIAGSFSTANLFGRGQTLQLAVERGARYRNDEISVLEPFFRGRPLSVGASIYRRRIEREGSVDLGVPAYTVDSFAVGTTAGRLLGRFSRFDAGYTFAVIDPRAQEAGADLGLLDTGRRRESRLSPTLTYDTVDSPLQPRHGVQARGGIGLVGGPLRGSVSYFEPHLKLVGWVPHLRRTALGVRLEGGWLLPFGDTARPGTLLPSSLPLDRRYFLGGEQQVRGFGLQRVGPRNDQGTLVGGNKYVLGSAEYVLDVFGPVRLVAFFDAGQSFLEGQRIDLGQLRTSTGVELRFLVPVLNVPVRIYEAWNPNRGPLDPAHQFRLTFGTSF